MASLLHPPPPIELSTWRTKLGTRQWPKQLQGRRRWVLGVVTGSLATLLLVKTCPQEAAWTVAQGPFRGCLTRRRGRSTAEERQEVVTSRTDLVEALEELGGRATKKALLAKGFGSRGLDRQLLHLAWATQGSVRFDSAEGDLVYDFPSNLAAKIERRERLAWVRQHRKRRKEAVVSTARGLFLLVTAVVSSLVVLAALGLWISTSTSTSKRPSRSSKSSSSSSSAEAARPFRMPSYYWRPPIRFWFGGNPFFPSWNWSETRRLGWSDDRGTRGQELGVLEAFLSFVFGDDDDEEVEEEDEDLKRGSGGADAHRSSTISNSSDNSDIVNTRSLSSLSNTNSNDNSAGVDPKSSAAWPSRREPWRSIISMIVARGGVVVPEELLPYLPKIPNEGSCWSSASWTILQERDVQQQLLEVLVRLHGLPEVADDGEVIYVFKELMESKSRTKSFTRERPGVTGDQVRFLKEAPLRFSQAPRSLQLLSAFLCAATLTSTLSLGFRLTAYLGDPEIHTWRFTPYVLVLKSMLPFLAVYSACLVAIPLLRWARLMWRNRRIRQRNRWRMQLAEGLRNPPEALKQRLKAARLKALESEFLFADDL